MRKPYIEVNRVYMERFRVATVTMGLLEKLVACVEKTPNKSNLNEFMRRHNALLLEYHSIYSGRITMPNHKDRFRIRGQCIKVLKHLAWIKF